MEHLIKLSSGEATELVKPLIQDKFELGLKNTMKRLEIHIAVQICYWYRTEGRSK